MMGRVAFSWTLLVLVCIIVFLLVEESTANSSKNKKPSSDQLSSSSNKKTDKTDALTDTKHSNTKPNSPSSNSDNKKANDVIKSNSKSKTKGKTKSKSSGKNKSKTDKDSNCKCEPSQMQCQCCTKNKRHPCARLLWNSEDSNLAVNIDGTTIKMPFREKGTTRSCKKMMDNAKCTELCVETKNMQIGNNDVCGDLFASLLCESEKITLKYGMFSFGATRCEKQEETRKTPKEKEKEKKSKAKHQANEDVYYDLLEVDEDEAFKIFNERDDEDDYDEYEEDYDDDYYQDYDDEEEEDENGDFGDDDDDDDADDDDYDDDYDYDYDYDYSDEDDDDDDDEEDLAKEEERMFSYVPYKHGEPVFLPLPFPLPQFPKKLSPPTDDHFATL